MPVVTVEAAYSKRRRKDFQPLRPDLAGKMKQWLADRRRRFRVKLTRPTFTHYVRSVEQDGQRKQKRCKRSDPRALPVHQQSRHWFVDILHADGRRESRRLAATDRQAAEREASGLRAEIQRAATVAFFGSAVQRKLWPRTW